LSGHNKWMNIVGVVLIALLAGGIAATLYFWPSNREAQSAAFFSLPQSVASFALIFLTFLYVAATQKYVPATQEQLADQNRAPKITVMQYYVPETDPFGWHFDVEIANPSVRSTSLGIKSLQRGDVFALDCFFEIDQTRKTRVTIPVRESKSVVVKARTFDVPVPINLGFKTKTLLTFDEVFHGTLPAVITEV